MISKAGTTGVAPDSGRYGAASCLARAIAGVHRLLAEHAEAGGAGVAVHGDQPPARQHTWPPPGSWMPVAATATRAAQPVGRAEAGAGGQHVLPAWPPASASIAVRVGPRVGAGDRHDGGAGRPAGRGGGRGRRLAGRVRRRARTSTAVPASPSAGGALGQLAASVTTVGGGACSRPATPAPSASTVPGCSRSISALRTASGAALPSSSSSGAPMPLGLPGAVGDAGRRRSRRPPRTAGARSKSCRLTATETAAAAAAGRRPRPGVAGGDRRRRRRGRTGSEPAAGADRRAAGRRAAAGRRGRRPAQRPLPARAPSARPAGRPGGGIAAGAAGRGSSAAVTRLRPRSSCRRRLTSGSMPRAPGRAPPVSGIERSP